MRFKNRQTLDKYWLQELEVKRISNRMDVFVKYCENKKVLHFGCTDFPIFNPENNLHLQLANYCSELHGFDIDIDGLTKMKSFHNSLYYSKFEEIEHESYDTVLVPETIEHVNNVQLFLEKIEGINAKHFIITAPNCFNRFFEHGYSSKTGNWIEGIHPDHNCWYSPYTLKNTIKKFTRLKVLELYLSNNDLMVICVCKKNDNE